MRRPQTSASGRGFTIIEAILVFAIIGIAVGLAVPSIQRQIHRFKLEGIARETKVIMQKARLEAVKRGVPAVVMILPDEREVFAFADVHGAALTDPSDGVFGDLPGVDFRATDYELGRLPLPAGISFASPTDVDLASVDQFVNTGVPDPPDKQAIFLSNGAAMSAGAIRFADSHENYLEVRVTLPATAQIDLRKYDPTINEYRGFGEKVGKPWAWN